MTDKEKLEKIKALADKMYSRMAYLTSDTRPIRQAMDEYHQFIVNEYHKEEPVSNDLELEEEITKCYKSRINLMMTRKQFGEIIHHFTEWQKEQMMAKAINTEASLTLSVPSICISLPHGVNVGDKVKVIVIKED